MRSVQKVVTTLSQKSINFSLNVLVVVTTLVSNHHLEALSNSFLVNVFKIVTNIFVVESWRILCLHIGASLPRAVRDDNRCEVCTLAGSFYNVVNHLFAGTTDVVL